MAFSTYFTYLVPAGVGLYWIASNLFAIANLYFMNFLYKPSKYIDYEALEESKKELEELKAKDWRRRSRASARITSARKSSSHCSSAWTPTSS